MAESKIYAPKVSAKEVKFQNGNSIIKLGIHADTLIEFLRQNKNEKGYVNLGISQRQTPGQYGDTHSVWLDTWKPSGNAAPPQNSAPKKPVDKTANHPTESDDVPF